MLVVFLFILNNLLWSAAEECQTAWDAATLPPSVAENIFDTGGSDRGSIEGHEKYVKYLLGILIVVLVGVVGKALSEEITKTMKKRKANKTSPAPTLGKV